MAPSTAISLLLSIISLTRDGNLGFRERERERERKTEERERERDSGLPSTDLVSAFIGVVLLKKDEAGKGGAIVEYGVIAVVTAGEW